MRLLSTLCALAVAASVAVSAPARAEDPTPASMKIAVVNVQGIMRDSTAAKSARDQLDAKQKAYQAEIAKKEESLQKEDQELAKQRGTLSKEAFEQKVSSLRSKAGTMQKEVAEKKAVLDNAFESSLGQIQRTVSDIITEMAKEQGFVLAMPASQLLYAPSSLDISAEVLKRLNARLPKIDVKFEAPAKK